MCPSKIKLDHEYSGNLSVTGEARKKEKKKESSGGRRGGGGSESGRRQHMFYRGKRPFYCLLHVR